MSTTSKKQVLLTNGTRFHELSETAYKNSKDLYLKEGYREASEEEHYSYFGLPAPEKKETAKPKGKAKDSND